MSFGFGFSIVATRGLSLAQRAIALLRSLGTSAHVWLPGANGVNVASLPSNNYLLSDGSTGYSTVDSVDGLTLDGMGALSSTQLVTNGVNPTTTTGFIQKTTGSPTLVASGGTFVCNSGTASNILIAQAVPTVIGNWYLVSIDVIASSGVTGIYVGSAPGFAEDLLQTLTAGLGTKIGFFKAARTTSYVQLAGWSASSTATLNNISTKAYSGIHLTQATTANKPLVRRGVYNLLTYSDSIVGGTGAWVLNAATQAANNALSPSGTLTATRIVASGAGTNEGIYLSALSTVGRVEVFSLWLKGAVGGEQVVIGDASNRKTVTLTTSWARYSDNGATRVNDHSVIYAVNNTAMTFYASQAQLEAGATAGDYTPTTATAASNPSAGKYWWSFDGSNDSLLSGNLGITNACTIVVAGRVNSLAATQVLFAENTNGVQIYLNTSGAIIFGKVAIADILVSSAGQIVAGVPFVITVRLSGGTAVSRLNGVQIATGATAYTFSAITGARIGTDFAGTGYPLNGALGWVVPIAAALSDADCLTVERLVAAQFPGLTTPDGDANSMLLEDGSGFLTMETGDLLLLE